MDCITALAGRTLLDGSGAVLPLKQDENPCTEKFNPVHGTNKKGLGAS
ncbi:hypothetical protein DsansV1_C27g0202131 [Dioscorea sansibarensis]